MTRILVSDQNMQYEKHAVRDARSIPGLVRLEFVALAKIESCLTTVRDRTRLLENVWAVAKGHYKCKSYVPILRLFVWVWRLHSLITLQSGMFPSGLFLGFLCRSPPALAILNVWLPLPVACALLYQRDMLRVPLCALAPPS